MARRQQMNLSPRQRHRKPALPVWVGWLFILILLTGVDQLIIMEHPLVRMVLLVFILFLLCKAMVYILWQHRTSSNLEDVNLIWFLFPWPGMRPDPFSRDEDQNVVVNPKEIRTCSMCLISGVLFLIGAYMLAAAAHGVSATVLLLAGLSLTVHFGLLGFWTALLRVQGFPVRLPFLNPFASRSLNQFWSQRWNRPFTELMSWTIYRPLVNRYGRKTAIFGSFVASGLLHEVAISVPVHAGYGLPTLYFVIQALGVLLEERWQKYFLWRWVGIWLWLVLPLPLVFHPAFIGEVLFPLIGQNPADLF